ncbi:hypothetical protein V6N13_124327 [Hibiscus sabdariffa]
MAEEFCLAAASNVVGRLMVDYLVNPIERRIRYLFHFPKLVWDFRKQQKKLNKEQTRVNGDVKEAKLLIQTHVIEDYVNEWLSDAENALKDAQCLNSHRAVLPSLELLPSDGIVASKSSTAAFNKIMEALKDDQIKMIGMLGIGGVAWDLFRMKAKLDERVSRDIMEEAKKVVEECKGRPVAIVTLASALKENLEECKGLPVAIITLASALKGTKTNVGWKLALKELENNRLIEIRRIGEDEENAYACIKMSYDYLKKETTKKMLLIVRFISGRSLDRRRRLGAICLGIGVL